MWTQVSLWFKIYNYLYACYRPSETWNFFHRSGGPVTNKFYWTFITFTGPTKFGTHFTYSYWCFVFHFYFQFHSNYSRSTILDPLSISHNIYDYLTFPHKLSRILFSFTMLHLFLRSSVFYLEQLHHRNERSSLFI